MMDVTVKLRDKDGNLGDECTKALTIPANGTILKSGRMLFKKCNLYQIP